MIHIDGRTGEGGGQVLRSSLTLSLLTGRPFRMTDIRGGRARPGLLRQHLTCVRAAEQIASAVVTGAQVGSGELTFEPRSLASGSYTFEVGTAGSTSLVLQTILLPLLTAQGRSTVRLTGGTHNPSAPTFDSLERSFGAILSTMGADVGWRLEQHGFYPAGGGAVTVAVGDVDWVPLRLIDRGPLVARKVRALVARISESIAVRECRASLEGLQWPDVSVAAEVVASPGPGNVLMIELSYERVTEIFAAFGQRGLNARLVAEAAVREALAYAAHTAPVGPHLADQLMLPAAVAGGEYRTVPLTPHGETNLWVIRQFLPTQARQETEADGTVRVIFEPR